MSDVTAFERVRSFDQALDVLAEQVVQLGFDAVDYAYLPRVRSPDCRWAAPDIVGRNFPGGWRQGWARFSSCDPYYRSAYCSNLPVDWDDVKVAPWLTAIQNDSIAYIGDFMGFADGVTVPVHLAGGRFAFVTAANQRRNAWRDERYKVEHTLLVLAHRFHALVARRFPERFSNVAIASVLKPREIECLSWAARGRNAPETALEIHRSTETVRFHLKNAMAKLEARTVAQAVARAAAADLIADGDPAAE